PQSSETPTVASTQYATLDFLDPYLFRIRVPSTWSTEEVDRTERLLSVSAMAPDQRAAIVVYALGGWSFDTDTVEELFQLWVKSFEGFAVDPRVGPVQDPGWVLPLLGGDASYTYTDPSGPRIRGFLRLIITDKWAYLLDLATFEDDWDGFQPIFDQVNDGFAFAFGQ
ncbi:MAG: hypothetical protein ACE5JL_15090, partial [Dehalococcoidia bacterium]